MDVRRQDHHHRLPKGGVAPPCFLLGDAPKTVRSTPGRLSFADAVQILFHLRQRPEQRLRTFIRLKKRLLVHNRSVLRLAPTAAGRRGQQPFDIRSFAVDLVADLRVGNQALFAVTLQGPFLSVQQQAHLLVVEPVLQRLVLTPTQLRHPPCQRLDARDQAVVTPFFNHHVLHHLVRLGFRERR